MHSATFMSARALQAADKTQADQMEHARVYLTLYAKKNLDFPEDKIPQLAKGSGGGGGDVTGGTIGPGSKFVEAPNAEARRYSWMSGVKYDFDMPLMMLPLMKNLEIDKLHFTSESWLGREVSDQECSSAMKGFNGKALYDNGC